MKVGDRIDPPSVLLVGSEELEPEPLSEPTLPDREDEDYKPEATEAVSDEDGKKPALKKGAAQRLTASFTRILFHCVLLTGLETRLCKGAVVLISCFKQATD